MKRIKEVYKAVKECPPKTIAVAAAGDREVLQALINAQKEGLIKGQLYGDAKKICAILSDLGENTADYEIIHTESNEQAAKLAVKAVREDKADIVMKGLMDSGQFIKALINKEYGIREYGRILSAVAALEVNIEGDERVIFITDPGFVPAPDLETKKQLIINTVDLLHDLGYEEPKVAVLSANEVVNPKMVSSTDAAALQKMYDNKEFGNCVVCGPISVDLALSKHSARHKGFDNPVAGNADILIVPNLETGNALVKGVQYATDCVCGGAVAGTTKPVVFTSRADTADTKKNCIAMAVLISERRKKRLG